MIPQSSSRILLRVGFLSLDLILINLAFLLAYWMRYEWGMGGEVSERYYVDLSAYLPIQIAYTLVLLSVYSLAGLYRQPLRQSSLDETATLLGATSVGLMLTLALVFLYQGYAYSRWLFFFLWTLTFLLVTMARLAKNLLLAFLRRRGIGVKRALVVGSGALGRMVMHVLATEPGLGYQVLGCLHEDKEENLGRFRSLGEMKDLASVVRAYPIDEVIIALPSTHHREIPQVIQQCRRGGLGFKIVPDLYELSLSAVDINDLRGIPLIGIKESSIRGFNLLLKRAFDLVLASLLLVIAAPLWALIALLIKLDSPGPVLFRQQRLGKGCRPFMAYKFRSMKQGAEEDLAQLYALNEASWPLFKIRNDPRVTRVGRFLRRTSLDELPQLINVVRGDMSLVGPRPPIPEEVERYEPWHRKRLEISPGITGIWQVSGRSDLPFDEMVMLDIYYIENWSLGLDFKILLRTIPAVLAGYGAY